MSTPTHLQRKRHELVSQYDQLSDKLVRLRRAVAVETDVATKLKIENDILSAEQDRAKLNDELSSVESQIKSIKEEGHELGLPVPGGGQRPQHNLPRRTYIFFTDREDEFKKLERLLKPYPESRVFIIVLDGVGGVGKSALALETAYNYIESYSALPEKQRFDSIVWISAKRSLLTPSGIKHRLHAFSSIDDLYREIAKVLNVPEVLHADLSKRRAVVEKALAGQRTLLVIDNLETSEDEELLAAIQEMPDPTKVIITTRHSIDLGPVQALRIRVLGLSQDESTELAIKESEYKNVDLSATDLGILYRKTGGVPLGIVWAIGLMGLGYSSDAVFSRLQDRSSDIAKFCFDESVERIRGRDSYRLLLTLSIFDAGAGLHMLGQVAGFQTGNGCEDALVELLKLSLVNQDSKRYSLLPLTRSYAIDELSKHPELEQQIRERWIHYLTELAEPYADFYWRRPDRRVLTQEGSHLVSLAAWCQQHDQPKTFLKIVPALAYYFDSIGDWGARISIGKVGLGYARLLGDLKSIIIIQAYIIAWIVSKQGLHEEAENAMADALDAATKLGSPMWISEVLVNYSFIVRRHNQQIERARDYCNRALELSQDLAGADKRFIQAEINYEVGRILASAGNWTEALDKFGAAREIFRTDDKEPTFNMEYAWSLYNSTGFALHKIGRFDEAARIYSESAEFGRKTGSKGDLAVILLRFAELEEQRGNRSEALKHGREALEWSSTLGMQSEFSEAEDLCDRLAES